MLALNVLLVLTLALAEVFSAPTQTPFQVPATSVYFQAPSGR